ncbi:recombinase family protein, partial [Chloroflexota bacterium]
MMNGDHDDSREGQTPDQPVIRKKMRGFTMLRVSDRKQEFKYGPAAQRAEAEVGAKECPIPLEVSRDREAFWVETGSGWSRKQFNIEMTRRLEEFQRGEWDILVFPRVDRETRFLAGSFEVLNQLLKAGVPIYFARHRLLLRQGDSEAFDIYFDLVREARAYIKVLKANTAGGRAQAMEAGRIPTGWGSRGLTGYDWKDKRFVKNSINPTVEFIFRKYLEGYSGSAIMVQLKKAGVLTKLGRPFSQSTVSNVLHHARWYAGTITYKEKEFRGLIEPIITENEAEEVLARLSRSRKFPNAYGRSHWWTGRVRCGLCQRRVSISKSHGCRCNGRDFRLMNPCPTPCMGFEAFQRAVSDALRITLSHPQQIFTQICDQFENQRKEMSFLSGELGDKQEKMAIVEARLERLSRQHEMGLLDDAQLSERSAQVAREAQELRVRIRELQNILDTPENYDTDSNAGLIEDIQDAFNLPKGSPQRHFMSVAAAIATKWVADLGVRGSLPKEETWQRLAEKMNLRMLVYPPDHEEVAGQRLKATVRITGEFFPGAAEG